MRRRLSPNNARSRVALAILCAFVVAVGLASRSRPFESVLAGKYLGDALWAWMVFLLIALLKPLIASHHAALLAWLISCSVEASQLYQAPWINSIRVNSLGHLVLGSAFSWR